MDSNQSGGLSSEEFCEAIAKLVGAAAVWQMWHFCSELDVVTSYHLNAQDLKPRIHMTESDFKAITKVCISITTQRRQTLAGLSLNAVDCSLSQVGRPLMNEH